MAPEGMHRTGRIGRLRAAVLGANDGLVSPSSLVVRVASTQHGRLSIILAAVAGMVVGALPMAAGECVSVSSQAETGEADLGRERVELAADPQEEQQELAGIRVRRGLTPTLAAEVAAGRMFGAPA
jgi:vacuolar iron transporter family protein